MTVFTPAASSVAEDSLQLPGAAIQTHEGGARVLLGIRNVRKPD